MTMKCFSYGVLREEIRALHSHRRAKRTSLVAVLPCSQAQVALHHSGQTDSELSLQPLNPTQH